MYHEMTPFSVFKCNKERFHKRSSVTMANTNGQRIHSSRYFEMDFEMSEMSRWTG